MSAATQDTYRHARTRTIDVGGTRFAYRELGADKGVPVVFLHHFTAVLDDWDPRVVDGLAVRHRVIAFDNRGVGASEGSTPDSVQDMARDAIAFIRALGLVQVDLFGFSLGGFIAQLIAEQEPQLVRRMILAGTGPAGGAGIEDVPGIAIRGTLKGYLTFKNPKYYLFFTKTANGRASARRYLRRLKERTEDRDKAVSPKTILAQMRAIRAWGLQEPSDLTRIHHPVLVANGDHDVMVTTDNSEDLARRLPDAALRLYGDAGHGGVFQYHDQFVEEAATFLGEN